MQAETKNDQVKASRVITQETPTPLSYRTHKRSGEGFNQLSKNIKVFVRTVTFC